MRPNFRMMGRFPLSWPPTRSVIVAAVTLIVAVFWLLYTLRSTTTTGAASSTASKDTFSLILSLQCQDADSKAEFQQLIQPFMNYIKEHEPTTMAFEVLWSDNDELQGLFLERYMNKEEAYLKIHKSSPTFLAFRPKLKAMQEAGRITISGNGYWDSGLGFMDRN